MQRIRSMVTDIVLMLAVGWSLPFAIIALGLPFAALIKIVEVLVERAQ